MTGSIFYQIKKKKKASHKWISVSIKAHHDLNPYLVSKQYIFCFSIFKIKNQNS